MHVYIHYIYYWFFQCISNIIKNNDSNLSCHQSKVEKKSVVFSSILYCYNVFEQKLKILKYSKWKGKLGTFSHESRVVFKQDHHQEFKQIRRCS
jgi:hypothetical protein